MLGLSYLKYFNFYERLFICLSFSSPLGELFDHGLDSSIVSLMGIGILSIFGLNEDTASVYELVFIQTFVLLAFYIAHWEKYTTSVLYLPWAYDISQLVIMFFYSSVSKQYTFLTYVYNLFWKFISQTLINIVLYTYSGLLVHTC